MYVSNMTAANLVIYSLIKKKSENQTILLHYIIFSNIFQRKFPFFFSLKRLYKRTALGNPFYGLHKLSDTEFTFKFKSIQLK